MLRPKLMVATCEIAQRAQPSSRIEKSDIKAFVPDVPKYAIFGS